jgi:hypothetical protein
VEVEALSVRKLPAKLRSLSSSRPETNRRDGPIHVSSPDQPNVEVLIVLSLPLLITILNVEVARLGKDPMNFPKDRMSGTKWMATLVSVSSRLDKNAVLEIG